MNGEALSPFRLADRTAAELQTHEAVCAERYAAIRMTLEILGRRIGRIELMIISCAGSLILGLGGVILTLALKLGH
jgi:hypothetical protein